MTTTVRAPSGHSGSHPSNGCGCGCKGEDRCCSLECLVRPNFYCGQLLTDADLKVMVEWARSRFGLARYRDGWGIVCGLEVTCHSPGGAHGSPVLSGYEASVFVGPGYAIDCCGNDLVVCDPVRVGLDEVCRLSDDPCEDPCDDRVVTPPGRGDPGREGKDPGRPLDFEGWKIPKEEIFFVDLSLRYGEELAEGHRTLLRSRSCSDVSGCEYGRVLERPKVHMEVVDLEDDREQKSAEDFEEQFKDDLEKAKQRIEALVTGEPEAVIRKLQTYPVYSICFITDYMRDQVGKEGEAWRQRLRGWLLLDWLQHHLLCPCAPCRSDVGVPLARLMIWRKRGRADCCRVMFISSGGSARRPLRLDCRPVPLGSVDLGRVIGKSLSEARAEMAKETIVLEDEKEASSLGTIKVRLAAERGARVRPQVVTDLLGTKHVVGLELMEP